MAQWKGCLPQGNPRVFAPICLRLPLLLDLSGVCSPINFKKVDIYVVFTATIIFVIVQGADSLMDSFISYSKK